VEPKLNENGDKPFENHLQPMSEPKAQQKISQFGQILDSMTDSRLSHPFLIRLSCFIAHSVRIIPAQLVIEPDFPNTNLFLLPDIGFQFEFSVF
jgi:hypothetical protein